MATPVHGDLARQCRRWATALEATEFRGMTALGAREFQDWIRGALPEIATLVAEVERLREAARTVRAAFVALNAAAPTRYPLNDPTAEGPSVARAIVDAPAPLWGDLVHAILGLAESPKTEAEDKR